MSSLIVWLDSEEARIFHFLPSGTRQENAHRHGPRHPVEALGVNHSIEQSDAERFYHHLAGRLRGAAASEILIVGPGPAREHFKNHLDRHHRDLVPSVCGVHKMERKSDPQIVDFAKDFFRHYHVFAGTP